MSRRFGRNQRRRAREAIAAADARIGNLEVAMQMDRALLARQREKIDAAEAFQREVAEIVGREAIIAGEPVNLQYKFKRDGRDSVQHYPHKLVSFALPDMLLPPARNADIDMVRAETLELLDVEVVADQLRNQMHALVSFAGARAGYAISRTAIARTPDQDLVNMIGMQLARQLVHILRNPK